MHRGDTGAPVGLPDSTRFAPCSRSQGYRGDYVNHEISNHEISAITGVADVEVVVDRGVLGRLAAGGPGESGTTRSSGAPGARGSPQGPRIARATPFRYRTQLTNPMASSMHQGRAFNGVR